VAGEEDVGRVHGLDAFEPRPHEFVPAAPVGRQAGPVRRAEGWLAEVVAEKTRLSGERGADAAYRL
jgi:hypothetical protein